MRAREATCIDADHHYCFRSMRYARCIRSAFITTPRTSTKGNLEDRLCAMEERLSSIDSRQSSIDSDAWGAIGGDHATHDIVGPMSISSSPMWSET
ncbi:hypothetical protein FNV43_RR13299 [Rhamnella rubrinervis]|uniref:Uncharacterized protein n=1 Tax=Rhamnella rubrinervis TaxID=2594499 RepID=A0A8K0H0T4_9ROSA|nr:hypothetical protein FNV43_RR13299 [Rhamnella rubrinervis]